MSAKIYIQSLAELVDLFMKDDDGYISDNDLSACERALSILVDIGVAERCGFADSKARFTGDIYDEQFISSKIEGLS